MLFLAKGVRCGLARGKVRRHCTWEGGVIVQTRSFIRRNGVQGAFAEAWWNQTGDMNLK